MKNGHRHSIFVMKLQIVIFSYLFHLFSSEILLADYPMHINQRCSPSEFDCNPLSANKYCIPLSAVRDCIEDCPNASDENCGVNKTICDVVIQNSHSRCGKCVHFDNLYSQCLDKKWIHLCKEQNTVKCANTENCVYVEWLNDSEDDCGDNSDENQCHSKICKDLNSEEKMPLPFVPMTSNNNFPNSYPCDCADILSSNPDADSRQIFTAYDSHCKNKELCSFKVVCNFELFDGGWTLIMRRKHPMKSYFNKTWSEYKKGFGEPENEGNFWIGNDRLHSLSTIRSCANELLIKLELAKEKKEIIARYDHFHVEDEFNLYRLILGTLNQQHFLVEDHMFLARNNVFTTWDKRKNCPFKGGGWWTPPNNCAEHALTGEFKARENYKGLYWGNMRIQSVEMMLRPQYFTPPVKNKR